jgi:hypothetical protein
LRLAIRVPTGREALFVSPHWLRTLSRHFAQISFDFNLKSNGSRVKRNYAILACGIFLLRGCAAALKVPYGAGSGEVSKFVEGQAVEEKKQLCQTLTRPRPCQAHLHRAYKRLMYQWM